MSNPTTGEWTASYLRQHYGLDASERTVKLTEAINAAIAAERAETKRIKEFWQGQHKHRDEAEQLREQLAAERGDSSVSPRLEAQAALKGDTTALDAAIAAGVNKSHGLWGCVFNDTKQVWQIISHGGQVIIDDIGEFRYADEKTRRNALKVLAEQIRDNCNLAIAAATESLRKDNERLRSEINDRNSCETSANCST